MRPRFPRKWLERCLSVVGLLALMGPSCALPAQGRATKAGAPAATPPEITLPAAPKAVRFAVIGDSGSGKPPQYETAQEMVLARVKFPFDFVLMCGDNIKGRHGPRAFELKFERPYGDLLKAGVKFYASLGNHDLTSERLYKPFNMGGSRYYSFHRGNATFLALDSNYMDPEQVNWLTRQLATAPPGWKICFFHHPLYSDGKAHGSALDLRARLQPLFVRYGVNVVFSGHDHVYERLKPQHGIYYFVEGNSGALRYHNLRRHSPEMAAGFDTDRAFMLAEIVGDQLYFQTISRTGKTVDHGVIQRQK
jgi:hypothetical protein